MASVPVLENAGDCFSSIRVHYQFWEWEARQNKHPAAVMTSSLALLFWFPGIQSGPSHVCVCSSSNAPVCYLTSLSKQWIFGSQMCNLVLSLTTTCTYDVSLFHVWNTFSNASEIEGSYWQTHFNLFEVFVNPPCCRPSTFTRIEYELQMSAVKLVAAMSPASSS